MQESIFPSPMILRKAKMEQNKTARVTEATCLSQKEEKCAAF